jgi:purine-nucleoside phosphorylase
LNTLLLASQTADAVGEIRRRWNCRPAVGIVLGTGLGAFTEEIQAEAVISYETIPHFARSTAIGHQGRLVCGRIKGIPVVTMDGRIHLYEGYTAQQVTFPVRVLAALGIEQLILSNASGGLNPQLAAGDILVIEDHINLTGANPWKGLSEESLQQRFHKKLHPYDTALIRQALQVARRNNFVAHQGVYVAVSGPNYETRAEYRFLRMIGGDVVGMSTVPEVLVAAQLGLRVLGLSIVTNASQTASVVQLDGGSVVTVAQFAEGKFRSIVLSVMEEVFAGRTNPTTPAVVPQRDQAVAPR